MGNSVAHSLYFKYDMRSQLTDANITNINGNPWIAEYIYHDNGDMASRTITGTAKTDFTYTGNLMNTASGGESFNLDWDENEPFYKEKLFDQHWIGEWVLFVERF